MPRRSAPDAPQGLNHSYYNPEEPVDINSQESSSSRRSKPEKSRQNASPGDDNKSRRSSHRDPSPGHSDMGRHRYLSPRSRRRAEYDRDAPKDSKRSSNHRDDDRRPRRRDYSPEPRERRHKSSNREPSRERYPRSRNASPDPRYRSSRSIPAGDGDGDRHSSHRSRGAPVYASDDERDRRRNHDRRRDEDRRRDVDRRHDEDRRRDKDRSRDKDRDRDKDRSRDKDRDQDRSHDKDRRSGRSTNIKGSSDRAKTPLWKNPQVQAMGQTALLAAAQAFMQHRKGEGSWVGPKGAKVVGAAVSAAFADGISSRKDKKRR